MWKIKKIIETIVVFLFVMLFICLGVSLYQILFHDLEITELFSKTGLYFLYTIGYGALEGDAVLQNILAMVGIVGLALMSTFLTINLFWRMDDVKFSKRINYDGDSLKLQFINKGRTICDMRASFILYDQLENQNIGEQKEYAIPMLIKNANWNLSVSLNDTFWYQAIYYILSKPNRKLYCIYSFVDTKSGQSSIKVEEINKNNLVLNQQILSYQEFIKPLILSKNQLLPIENNGRLTLSCDSKFLTCAYQFKSKNSGFVMAYYNFHQDALNLEKYDKNKTYLSFDILSKKDAVVILEFKNKEGTIKSVEIKTQEEELNFQLPFGEFQSSLENITEICFVIFSKNNYLANEINISDLKIITK